MFKRNKINLVIFLIPFIIGFISCKKTNPSNLGNTPESPSLLIQRESWYAQDGTTLQATTVFEYDSLNRQKTATTTIVNGNITFVENTAYYNKDSVVMTHFDSDTPSSAEKFELGTNGLGTKYTEYTFSNSNRIASGIIQYLNYDSQGYLIQDSSVFPNNTHSDISNFTYLAGNMIQITETDSSNISNGIFVVVNTETEQYNDTLNTIGLRNVGIYYEGLDSKNLITQDSQTAPPTGPYTYTYDSKGRVITCTAPGNTYGPVEAFTYMN